MPVGGNKFLGLRFKLADGYHYGWLRMTVDEDPTSPLVSVGLVGHHLFFRAEIQDWAYESTPGQSILAGATIDGDADLNGTVNGADLNTVLSNYNKTGMGWTDGDFDGNGTVNGADLNIVLSNYNQSAGVTAAVPEPGTLGMLALGAVGVLAWNGWRKRK